ncbi:hypothetical protein D3C80_377190 [compost metagenome]
MRNARFGTGVAQVFGVLGPGLFLGAGDYHGQAHEYFDRLGITPGSHGGRTHLVDLGSGAGLGLATDEHAFGVVAGKAQTALGAARLEQYRGALWRRFAQVISLDPIELALVTHFVHFVRPSVDALLTVVGHRVVFPAAFEQLVQHLHVFIGLVVAAVVFSLLLQAHGPGGAVQIAGDNVPADPATAQVVEGRELAGEQIRRFVGQVGRQAKAQVAGHGGHGRYQQQRVVDR